MKQNIFTVIFLLLSTVCKAQTFIYPQNDSILTEYNDGKFWAYLNKNNFVVFKDLILLFIYYIISSASVVII